MVILIFSLEAQVQTLGLFINEEDSYPGYTLFTPMRYSSTYLIDNNGLLINEWESTDRPNLSVYLSESGDLYRTSKSYRGDSTRLNFGGVLQRLAWDSTVLWNYDYSNSEHAMHHDIELLPNGNVLILAYEVKSVEEANAAGRINGSLLDNELWPEHIIEVEQVGADSGNIVWEWHVWDHLIQDQYPERDNYGIIEDHPELIDINYSAYGDQGLYRSDWTHMNSVKYNEDLDQIVISVHNFNEIWIIDHSTTSQEAASHIGGIYGKGGDLLYRWGNPAAYNRGSESEMQLFGQHDAQWIKPGLPGEDNILIFNNGYARPEGEYSTVIEIVLPVDSPGNYSLEPDSTYGPEEPVWIYSSENLYDFYSRNVSGAQRMPNGNTLICSGFSGIFFEVTPVDDIVWHYVNPVTISGPLHQGEPADHVNVFKIRRYPVDYPGLSGQDLTPQGPIELYHVLDEPQNVEFEINNENVHVSWHGVQGATGYTVYSSYYPYEGFTEDTTGSYNDFSWTAPFTEEKRFYYVKARTPYN